MRLRTTVSSFSRSSVVKAILVAAYRMRPAYYLAVLSYRYYPNSVLDIYVMNADGTGVTWLTHNLTLSSRPQLAEVAVPREVFRQVLERIDGLHPATG